MKREPKIIIERVSGMEDSVLAVYRELYLRGLEAERRDREGIRAEDNVKSSPNPTPSEVTL